MAYNSIPTLTEKDQTSDSEHVELTVNVNGNKNKNKSITNKANNNHKDEEKELEIPMECKRNIYNLFLIANYRNDERLNLKDHDAINQKIRYTLGTFAYLTAITQWLAFIVLFMVTILSSDRPNIEWYWSLSTGDWNIWMWPFWVIALIFALKEGNESRCDILILDKWNIKTISFRHCDYSPCCHESKCKVFQVFFFKVITEKYFGYFASVAYFTVLALYANGHEWERVLESIFRLIEFQFILEAKDWAFYVFERPMKVWLAQTSDIFLDFGINELFEGEMCVERAKSRHSAHYSFPISMWPLVYVIVWSFYLQAFYTNDLVFIVFASGVLVVWIVWCFVAYYFQKR